MPVKAGTNYAILSAPVSRAASIVVRLWPIASGLERGLLTSRVKSLIDAPSAPQTRSGPQIDQEP